MPFTFSHPAIVLPLKKIWKYPLSLTGLIVGSLTPDFEYFISMKIQNKMGHSPLGVFYYDLPIGLILCFIFHLIVKKPLIENLPSFLQIRLDELKLFSWNQYFVKHYFLVALSIILGAYSHILWDSFTHPGAYFVNYLHLEKSIPILNIPIYKFLQHVSTIIGAVFIAFYINKLSVNKIQITTPNFNYWLKIIVLSSLILLVRITFDIHLHFGNIIVSGISAMMMSVIVISFLELKKLNVKTSS